jgi:hypothetical protein
MHELGLAQAIVDVVRDAAGEQPVLRISVRVGAAEAVAADSLEFNVGLITEGTPLEGARTEVTTVDGDGIRVDAIVLGDGGEVIRNSDLAVVEAAHASDDQHRHPAWN